MDNQFKFTRPRLQRLTCPTDKTRTHFQDALRPELQLQVTRTGTKSYYCRCWNTSKGYTDRIYIGKFEQVELSDARQRARELAVQANQGIGPGIQRKPAKHEATFEQAFESFLCDPTSRKKKGPRREVTTEEYQKQYERYLSREFGNRRLAWIDRTDVDDMHTRVGKDHGPYAANRALTVLSGVFSDAISKGYRGPNPAQGIERFPEKCRERFLEEHELRPFLKACETQRESGCRTVAEAVLVALFTGLRRTNVCCASWQQIDLDRGVWSLSDERMKNRQPHKVYLCEYVKGILAKRHEERGHESWVFPGPGKTGHLVEPKKGLRKLAHLAGIDPHGVGMHCLRHTFLTYADDLGLPRAVRKRLAAHQGKSDVTDGYTHALERRVRESFENVAQHMLKVASNGN